MFSSRVQFPNPSLADDNGLLAMGGDLAPDTLISAYAQGIFPWFNDDQPILWWSPDPRLVLYPAHFKRSRSLLKFMRNSGCRVTANQNFEAVIDACATRGLSAAPVDTLPVSLENSAVESDTEERNSTWITQDMHAAYMKLHELGVAHSIEVWHEESLVGGLYGIQLGRVFFGESMFSVISNASKMATAYLCAWGDLGNLELIDCQLHSDHLESLGATEIDRRDFLEQLESHVRQPDIGNLARLSAGMAQLSPDKIWQDGIKMT